MPACGLHAHALITNTLHQSVAVQHCREVVVDALCHALQTIHWLRYGCLPVFVIEGRTPEAKLDKLRARWDTHLLSHTASAPAVLAPAVIAPAATAEATVCLTQVQDMQLTSASGPQQAWSSAATY